MLRSNPKIVDRSEIIRIKIENAFTKAKSGLSFFFFRSQVQKQARKHGVQRELESSRSRQLPLDLAHRIFLQGVGAVRLAELRKVVLPRG